MNYKPRTNKAFTLIELVVAIAILVMLISFAGVIFKVSINSHRTAQATAEIMQKLRAITDQLNSDFKDFRKDGYLSFRSAGPNIANPPRRIFEQTGYFILRQVTFSHGFLRLL
jgi:prepilin-type N-terminal cleavage/methylation domain-containing protein